VVADIETALVIHELLDAIGVGDFSIRINNRQILNGLLTQLDLADKSVPILRALDKLAKVGGEEVLKEMAQTAGVDTTRGHKILEFAALDGPADNVLRELDRLLAGSELGQAGITRMRDIVAALQAAGLRSHRYQIDVSIARGLDYYTGVIFETMLGDLPSIGSICSGGRYDNLAELYTKQHLPGIGASLGLDRLLAALESLKRIEKVRAAAPVLVTYFDKAALHDYLRIAAVLRHAGIGTELYPEPKKLGVQLKYADHRGFRAAIIAGSDELGRGSCQVKDLRLQSSIEVPWRDDTTALLAAIRKTLE